MLTSNTASKAIRKDTARVIPNYESELYEDIFDSMELTAAVTRHNFFPAVADPNPLNSNYEKQPFASDGEVLHLTRMGFLLNTAVVVIAGADYPGTAAKVAKFHNNFGTAVVQYGTTGKKCDSGEIRLSDLLAMTFDTQYLSSTLAVVHISTTPLPVLRKPIVLSSTAHLSVEIVFGSKDGFPDTGTTAGTDSNDLRLECHVSGYGYQKAAAASVANQIKEKAAYISPLPALVRNAPTEAM